MDNAVLSRRRLLGRSLASSAVAAMAALGIDLRPTQARAWTLRIAEAKQYPSVCPYCAVGCDTLVYAKDGAIVNIEGNPDSPINQGTLCPKGAAIYQLHVNPNRLTQVLLPPAGRHGVGNARAGRGDGHGRRAGQEDPRRDLRGDLPAHERRRQDRGEGLMATTAIFSLGGATMDNEWNHVQQKLMRGLGVVAIENQARI